MTKKKVETIQAKAKKLSDLRHDILNHIATMKVWHKKMEEWNRKMEEKARNLLDELYDSIDIIKENHRKNQRGVK